MTQTYSREESATLPTTTADLTTAFVAGDYTAVATADGSYVSQSATGDYAIFEFKDTVTGSTVDITWTGKTDLDPSTNNVILQVWNQSLTTWQTKYTYSTSTVGSNFTMSVTGLATADYLVSGSLIARVYQAASSASISMLMASNGAGDYLNASATNYHTCGGGIILTSIKGGRANLVTANGVLSNLTVTLSKDPTANVAYTLMYDGVASSMTCTVASGNTSATDSSNSVNVAAGHNIELRVVTDAILTDVNASVSMKFTATTAKQSLLFGGSGTSFISTSTTEYFSLAGGQATFSTTKINNQIVMPCAGYIKNLYVVLSDPPGAGTSRTFAVNKNGSDDGSLVVTLAGAGAGDGITTGNHTADPVHFAAGDLLTISSNIASGAPAQAQAMVGITFEADTNNQFVIPYAGIIDNAATKYYPLWGSSSIGSATAALASQYPVANFTAKNLYVHLAAGPFANSTVDDWYKYEFYYGSPQLLTVTLTNTDVDKSDTSDTVAVSSGNAMCMKVTPNSSPTQAMALVSICGEILA